MSKKSQDLASSVLMWVNIEFIWRIKQEAELIGHVLSKVKCSAGYIWDKHQVCHWIETEQKRRIQGNLKAGVQWVGNRESRKIFE